MNIDVYNMIIVFIFGLVLGSFYNVVAYRLPNNKSIIYPPSNCPYCGHKLKFYELIPVLSYIFLRGKCSSCKKKISILYPLFELITGISFLLSYLKFGYSIDFLISITFISVLIIVSISDIRYFIIPDEVLIVGIIMIIILLIIKSITSNVSALSVVLLKILNGLGSFSILYLFKFLGDFLFKKESLGGGDIKLLFLVGLTLGFDMSIVTIFIASFIALPISTIALIKKNSNVLPFGPYISLAATFIMLYGLKLDMILNFFVS